MSNRNIASKQLQTADGETLEAELHEPDGDVRAVVIATHPHPLYGGDMTNTAPALFCRVFPPTGIAALRFNFRGVGASSGSHGEGVTEVNDILAAIDLATERHPNVPVILAGYSFGADVALQVTDERLTGWFLVAPPVRLLPTFDAGADPRPKHLAIPAHDQFNPPERAASIVANWKNATMTELASIDHFLLGGTDRIADLAISFVEHVINSR